MAHAYTAYADVARKSLGKFKKASFHLVTAFSQHPVLRFAG
jgi:hypothetical protein